jgi:membrane associated rhomboid family serine protease
MNDLMVKYAIIGAVLAPAGVFLAGLLGMNMAMGYVSAAIAGAVGGAIGGFIRQKQGKNS